MKELLNYLRNPIYCSNQKPKLVSLLFLILFYLGATIIISPIVFSICSLFQIKHSEIALSPLMKILVVVILAPLYEEIIFRSLLKFKKINIILFVVTASSLIAVLLFRSKIVFATILSILLLFLLCLLIVYSRREIESFISSKFKYFLYVSSICFGVLHSQNYSGNIYLIIAFSFILGGSQIVLGFILGYIRMNNGLVYSILFHMIINSSILLSLLK